MVLWHPGLDGCCVRCCCYQAQEVQLLPDVLALLPESSPVDCTAPPGPQGKHEQRLIMAEIAAPDPSTEL
ncbi:hypothetical protein MTO96_021842 [Rhipicephalus appendiculatus]